MSDSGNESPLDLPLAKAARERTALAPEHVGYWLMQHCRNENLTETDLLDKLHITSTALTLLALCRTPRPEFFHQDLTKIAGLTSADPALLAGLLRQEQNLLLLRGSASTLSTGVAWLLAAHEANQPVTEFEDDPRSS